MANPTVSSLSGMLNNIPGSPLQSSDTAPNVSPTADTGQGGGSAMDGLNQVDQGAQTTRGAIGTAQNALGGNPTGGATGNGISSAMYKKGGSVKRHSDNSGKLNLSSGKVSTAVRNKSNPNW